MCSIDYIISFCFIWKEFRLSLLQYLLLFTMKDMALKRSKCVLIYNVVSCSLFDYVNTMWGMNEFHIVNNIIINWCHHFAARFVICSSCLFNDLFAIWFSTWAVTYYFCSCWLTTEKGFIWAFVGPVCAILFVSFYLILLCSFTHYKVIHKRRVMFTL